MSVPQMKEGPASMLRAMFAGFGSLMSVMDKVRAKPAAEAPADAEATTAATTPAPEDTAAPEPEATADPATVAAQADVEPETAVAPEPAVPAGPEASAGPETSAVAEPAAAEAEASAGSETSGALPLANYDELSVASLRARLRNLSNDDLTLLMAYERAHQDRPEVIKMFQNRLIKMTTGLPKLES
jgi:hypothetical protein